MSYADTTRLPLQLRSLVESELQSGERIIWMDQPMPAHMARKTLPMVLFGIPWTGFAIFWTVGAAGGISKIHSGPGLFSAFPLFGVPFILIGLGLLSSPYWARRKAMGSVYVLTDRRAVLFNAGLRGTVTVRSFVPERLDDLQRKQRPDGSGDLVFDQDVRTDSEGQRSATDVGFLGIRDVKSVEEMVRSMVARSAVVPR